jgi:predicted O-methyltransferase YrrM
MLDAGLVMAWTENYVTEPAAIKAARNAALEHGVEPITPAMGSFLASLASLCNAQTIVEVGTGLGVASQWLLTANPESHLTSIEKDVDHQQTAKDLFAAAGLSTNRIRLISGEALDILPRMNEASYDLIVINAMGKGTLELTRHALHLARVGGVVAVTHALAGGSVAQPTARDAASVEMRTVLGDYAVDENVRAAMVPVGDGILTLVKL